MELHPFDLQIQSTASDGKHTPRECVEMAKTNGLHTIAITDHDTVGGVAEALIAGQELGVRVIPGIEMTAEEHNIHLLGFGIDVAHPPLVAAMEKFAEGRMVGAQEMVQRLQADFVVPWEDVLEKAKGAVITRPHIVDVILAHPENKVKLGGVSTRHEFFRQFFSDASKYYVHRSHVSAKEAIGLLHDAGGVAVWSHPPIPDFMDNCVALEEFLRELISYDIDGIERFGPSLTTANVTCLETLAARYHLLITGGSDFHERYDPAGKPWPRSAAAIGEFPAYGRSLEDILPALDAAMAKRQNIAKTP